MRNKILFGMFFFGFFATPLVALQLPYPKGHFSVDLDFPGAALCVTYPENLRDAKNCEGVNLPVPWEEKKGLSMIGMGAVRFPRFAVTFVAVADHAPKTGPPEVESAQKFLKGFISGVTLNPKAGALLPLDSGMITVNQQPVYHYHGDLEIRGAGHLRMFVYYFCGEDYRYILSFSAEAQHDKDVQKVAERFLNSVKVPPPTGSEEAEQAYRDQMRGETIGHDFFYLLLFAGFVYFAVWVIRGLLKGFSKKSPPK